MNLDKILQNIGLPEREIKIYLALLELGDSTVLPIAKLSGIKRTYCYDILDVLVAKSLVTYYEKNGRRRYVAEDPSAIEGQLRQRVAQFGQILPELRSIYAHSAHKPRVRFYEGKEGLAAIYDQLVDAKEYSAIGSADLLVAALGDHLVDLGKKIVKKGIRARELLATKNKEVAFVAGYKAPKQEVRFLPDGLELATDMVMFDNKLVLVSYVPDVHAIVIEGSSIVETQQKLFDLLWAGAGKK